MSFYYYQFEMAVDGAVCDVAILYKYLNGAYDRQLDETIDALTKRRLPPDRILIVCPRGLEQEVSNAYKKISQSTMERLRGVANVAIAVFDHHGKVNPEAVIQLHDLAGAWRITECDIESIITAGMKHIVEMTGTRMTAPPGYVFRKPSENTHRVFIRAGNMIKDPAALAVAFHAMARMIPFGAKRLYIDSFTILSIALTYQRSMESLAKACGVDFEVPTITNFHSYSLDPNFTFETTDDYIVLISATSSGGLAQRLFKEHNARIERIYHLLAFSNDLELAKTSVYFQQETKKEPNLDGSFLKVISIPGEEFLASHGDTRTVDLKTAHLVPRECEIYKNSFYQEAFALNLFEAGFYGGAFRPIVFRSTDKIGSEKFIDWLNKQAAIDIPASSVVAIAADNERSKQLAQYLVSVMPGSKNKSIPVVTLSDLQEDKLPEDISKTDSVLIVCSDENDGESLLSISQLLRDKPHLHRHYVIGHLFPSSARHFKRLRSNLRVNGRGKQYGWSVYCVTPLGDESIHQSWLFERRFNYKNASFPSDNAKISVALQRRAGKLNEQFLLGDDLFLPKVNGELLSLRDESVLFDGIYKNISQVTIYVQVAAALQRARDRQLWDDRVLSDDLCFENNPFIDTVIDPDTFSRFNDGVIQAAILRSAIPSELNYSRNQKLSQHMLNIFSAIINSRGRDRGEAALEFMLAAALKKLRFHRDHFSIVEELVAEDPTLSVVWSCFKSETVF